jgi:hypothetical protein
MHVCIGRGNKRLTFSCSHAFRATKKKKKRKAREFLMHSPVRIFFLHENRLGATTTTLLSSLSTARVALPLQPLLLLLLLRDKHVLTDAHWKSSLRSRLVYLWAALLHLCGHIFRTPGVYNFSNQFQFAVCPSSFANAELLADVFEEQAHRSTPFSR